MRSYYADIFKQYFYHHLIQTRTDMHLTQPQMADLLQITVRNYINLDHGKNSCSGLTLSRYLIYCCPDPAAFLDGLCTAYEKDLSHTHRRSEHTQSSDAASYRQPLAVTNSVLCSNRKLHPVCPRCAQPLERENLCYCSSCGQSLSWHRYRTSIQRILH